MKCCCLLLRSSSAQTPSFRCITSSSSETVNLSENCVIPDLQQLFDYTYFDIWRQASWEMPDTGHLPSTRAVTAGTHVALNDPSDWRDRDSRLSPGISLFFLFGYYIQNVKSDGVLQLLTNYYKWGCSCKFCLFHVTLSKSIDKMYSGKIILGGQSESEWRNKRTWICYMAVCLRMIQIPVLI